MRGADRFRNRCPGRLTARADRHDGGGLDRDRPAEDAGQGAPTAACRSAHPATGGVPVGRFPVARRGTPPVMSEMDPRDPSTLYAAGPVAPEPPEDDLPETSPLPDSGGTGPGPDDLDRLL